MDKKIWIIDDNKNEAVALRRAIEQVDARSKFDIAFDFADRNELESAIPKGEYFDDIEVCLVDLELLKVEKADEKRNVSGANVVLPRLREIAPWVPIVAVSGYFDESNLKTQPTIACYSFDGILSKDALIGNNSLYHDLWMRLLRRFRDNLFERTTLHPRPKDEVLPRIVCHGDTESDLRDQLVDKSDEYFNRVKLLIAQCFWFAKEVHLETLQPGYSGAKVFQAKTESKSELGNADARWVLKTDTKPSRLARELHAHMQIVRCGLPHSLAVHPLWRGILAIPKFGMIAYQHAANKGTASSFLSSNPLETNTVIAALREIVGHLIRRPCLKHIEFNDVINGWFKDWRWSKGMINKVECAGVSDFLSKAAPLKNSETSSLVLECNYSLIHGDLHLSNVLIGDPNTLIDFSRSGFGPIVIDLAKMISDFWIEIPSACTTIPDWNSLEKDSRWKEFTSCLDFTNDDKKLFDWLVQLYLCCAPEFYSSLKGNSSGVQRIQNVLRDWPI